MEIYRNELLEYEDKFSFSLNTNQIFGTQMMFEEVDYKYFNSVPNIDLDIHANYSIKIKFGKKSFIIDLGNGMEMKDLSIEYRPGINIRKFDHIPHDYGYIYYLYDTSQTIILYNVKVWISKRSLNHDFPMR